MGARVLSAAAAAAAAAPLSFLPPIPNTNKLSSSSSSSSSSSFCCCYCKPRSVSLTLLNRIQSCGSGGPSPLSSWSYSRGASSIANKSIKCQAAGESSDTTTTTSVYQGFYGPWTVDSSDVREVISYRSGLVTAAASFVIAASTAFLPDNMSFTDLIKQNLDFFYALGAAGLGLSLLLIHIYVTEIKRTLQALWALGVLGSLATYLSLAQPTGHNLIQYVIDNPNAVWFVGPLFASLTGLVFKEGLCYGKLEAGILTFVIPSVLLGHLTGLMDDGVKVTLLGTWMALFVIFAGRKFTQPIKDDIGDKSVFMFNALPEEQKKALIEKLEQSKVQSES